MKLNEYIHQEIISRKQAQGIQIHDFGSLKIYLGMDIKYYTNSNVKDIGLFKNFVYKINKINLNELGKVDSIIIKDIHSEDEKTFEIKKDSIFRFKYVYSSTGHSTQGATYKDCPISIFDLFSFRLNNSWLYTSISRTNNFKNVFLNIGDNTKSKHDEEKRYKEMLTKRIHSYISQDRNAKRDISENYIDYKYIDDLIKSTELKCCKCNKQCDLYPAQSCNIYSNDLWSIDRIDSRFDHNKRNCQLMCLGCNRTKGNSQ